MATLGDKGAHFGDHVLEIFLAAAHTLGPPFGSDHRAGHASGDGTEAPKRTKLNLTTTVTRVVGSGPAKTVAGRSS